MTNHIALVTGASRGLGFAIAQALVAEGAKVVITGRGAAALDAAAHRLGPSATAVVADVGDAAQARHLFDAVSDRFGRLDLLVNNAAVGIPAAVEHITDADLDAQLRSNLYGPIHCIRGAIPLMRAAGGGDVVNISSESVNLPFPLLAPYAASKAALETLSRGLRAELSRDNIRISVLRVGAIDGTGFGDHWTDAQRASAFELWSKSGHLALVNQHQSVTPAVIADAVVDIATLPASGAIDLMELRAR